MQGPWRLIRTEQHTAFDNMAIDHMLLDCIQKGEASNTLRFYRWFPSTVSIGQFQRVHDEVDVDTCKEKGIDIVRRRSSGGAVYHDFEGELTYTIVCRRDGTNIPRDIIASYQHLCTGIIEGFRHLGVQAEFSGGSERACPNLFVKGRKISGNAQSRSGQALLQHGTILRRIDLDLMFSVLKVDRTKADCLTLKRAATRLTSLEEELDVLPKFKHIEDSLLAGFTKVLDTEFEEKTLTAEETRAAQYIAKTQYASSKWNFRR